MPLKWFPKRFILSEYLYIVGGPMWIILLKELLAKGKKLYVGKNENN
jgi:hypothetical protein